MNLYSASGFKFVIGFLFFYPTAPRLSAQPLQLIDPPPWARHYTDGEKIVYHMKATNRGQTDTRTYTIDASGSVMRDSQGLFFEEFAWKNLSINRQPVGLSSASSQFRQHLALPLVAQPADFMKIASAMSQLGKLDAGLIGPVADLTTFYVDMLFCSQFGGWTKVGDHRYIDMAGQSNSWADGNFLVIGEDSIDFECTVRDIDNAQRIATLVIEHLPPKKPRIKLPAEWMRAKVAETENNWVEVKKNSDGTYTASVGKETFEVVLKVSLTTGRILSAKMDNPVEILERTCNDAGLTQAGEPRRYQIRREIELSSE